MTTTIRKSRFFAWLVGRPVMLSTVLTTCVVIGLISFDRIPVQMMPDGIVEPGLQVFVMNPGASAAENEEQVARVLEQELRTLSGIERIGSTSRENSVGIMVEFKADTDMDFAKAEVRDRVERARPSLPTSVEEVGIFSWSESDMPVMFFAMLHPGDSDRTDFLVETVIKRRLDAVDGVGQTELWGLRDDSLRILLDEDKVKAASLDLGALIRRLSADNFATPLGEVEDGGSRILLRSDMRFRSVEEIEEYPVGNGLAIRDIGQVLPVKTIQQSLFRIDGSYSYYGEVKKDAQSNVVETCDRLRAAIAELERDPALAGEFRFLVIFDQGEFIRSSISQLEDTALLGGALAVLVLFLFLWRVRLTLVVALSIPLSLLLAVAWMYFTGGTFNVLAMTGITLAMGMLVDNAIVVAENITRLRAEGRSIRDAAAEGAGEVGLAVLLSTMTTVVVFMPIIFMTENPMLRIMFGELGLPLCVALIASLLVALVFLPVATRYVIGPRPAWLERGSARFSRVAALPARAFAWIVAVPRAAFFAALRAAHAVVRGLLGLLAPLRWPLALAAVGLAAWQASRAWPALQEAESLARTGAIAPALPFDPGALGWSALLHALPAAAAVLILLALVPRWRARLGGPPAWPERIVPAGESVIGLVIASNRALIAWTMENRRTACFLALLGLLSIAIPKSRMAVSKFGQEENKSRITVYLDFQDDFTLPQASEEIAHYERFLEARREQYGLEHVGARFSVAGGRLSLFWEAPQKQAHLDKVNADLRANLPRLAGHKLRFSGDDEGQAGQAPSRTTAVFRLLGPDSEELERLGAQALALLERVPGIASLSSPLESAPPQVRVDLDADLAQRLGVTASAALQNIAWVLRGAQLPRYHESGREVPLIIEYDEEEVAGLDTLRDLDVYTAESSVPLSAFSELQFGRGSRTIFRHDGQASFAIEAKVENPAQLGQVSEQALAPLRTLDLPRGYSIDDRDTESSRQEEEFKELFSALLLSVVLVFLLMGILFESFLLPLSVLFTIPYAVVGSYWTLYLTGTAMDSVGWIGIIILVGVVVNNGIVLIDRIHSLVALGWERKAAVLEGCANRVRPILMTALTSVIGLWPMAVTEPPGQGIDYRALATCVAGGLVLSTFFTLWVVPLAYTLIDDFARATSAHFAWALRPWRRGAVDEREPEPKPELRPS